MSFIDAAILDPNRKRDELVEVVKAMSLHGTEGRTELRDQIVSSYDVLLDVHPQMMEYIVKDLIAWKRFELKQRISNIEAQGRRWISLRRKPFVSIWVRRSQANDDRDCGCSAVALRVGRIGNPSYEPRRIGNPSYGAHAATLGPAQHQGGLSHERLGGERD